MSGKDFKELTAFLKGCLWGMVEHHIINKTLKIVEVKNADGGSETFLNDKAMVVERQLISDAELFKMQDAALEKGESFLSVMMSATFALYLSTLLRLRQLLVDFG